jgi:dienelactone hydrolase
MKNIASPVTGPIAASARMLVFVLKLFPMLPSRPVDWVTRKPLVEEVTYPTARGQAHGTVYRPSGSGRHPAMLVCLGVVPIGVDHPQVSRLGMALARSGFAALLYWSPAMRDFRLDPDDAEDIAVAFDWLLSQPYVDPARSGLLGTCVGASFALMAAATARIRDRVRFIAAYAPYLSMWTLVQDAASSTTVRDTTREPWEVDPLTRKVFVRSLITALEPDEAALLEQSVADGNSDLDTEWLSACARTVYALLTQPTSEKAEQALRELPETLRQRLTALSPIEYLSDIRTPLIVLAHDRGDQVIPVGESRRLRDALSGHRGFHYTEMQFQHLDPARLPLFRLSRELCKFYFAMYPIFRQ